MQIVSKETICMTSQTKVFIKKNRNLITVKVKDIYNHLSIKGEVYRECAS